VVTTGDRYNSDAKKKDRCTRLQRKKKDEHEKKPKRKRNIKSWISKIPKDDDDNWSSASLDDHCTLMVPTGGR